MTSRVALERWWPETVTAAQYPGIQPDEHALWTSNGRTTGLFLECDLGTENLPRLISKLTGYTRLARSGGPLYPVLFWLPPGHRETNLQKLLRTTPPPIPVATATHDTDPAGPVWLPVSGWQRAHLHDLPSSHADDPAAHGER